MLDEIIFKRAEDVYQMCRKRQDDSFLPVYRLFTSKTETMAVELEKTGKKLWRYQQEGRPFCISEWEKTLKLSWEYKKGFPNLYNEKGIYDKREVVICALMAARLTMKEADEFLDCISVKDQSFDIRRLYPLHFKEGFFRMIIRWNELHNKKVSFDEAIMYYEAYEKLTLEKVLKCIKDSSRQMDEIKEELKTLDIYAQTCKYQDICLNMKEEMENWHLPLSLPHQDELQRMIVVVARWQDGLRRAEDDEWTKLNIIEKNRNTRRPQKRGTRFCLQVIERCAQQKSLSAAVTMLSSEALSSMGEAYWRAVARILKEYGSSGEKGYADSIFVEDKVNSYRNKRAKTYKNVKLFEQDAGTETIMSFSLEPERIKEEIREESANTVLVAKLLMPGVRAVGNVFERQCQNVSQASLSALLSSYMAWCEGKGKKYENGRTQMPYYCYKRETMIEYALACGCNSVSEMKLFLEFTGMPELNESNPKELLVSTALEVREKTKELPIKIIVEMQDYFFYFIAEEAWRSATDCSCPTLERYIKYYMECVLYPFNISFGLVEDRMQFGMAMLLICMLITAAGEKIQNIPTDGEQIENVSSLIIIYLENQKMELQSGESDIGKESGGGSWIEYMDDLDTYEERYEEELADDILELSGVKYCYEERENEQGKEEKIRQILEKLNNVWGRFSFEKYGNASELKFIYDKWFMALGMLKRAYRNGFTQKTEEVYKDSQNLLKKGTVLWTVCGGCSNFSIEFYEKHYKINHFRQDGCERKSNKGSRWIENAYESKRQMLMWDDLCENVETIRRCWRFMKKDMKEYCGVCEKVIKKYEKQLENVKKELSGLIEAIKLDTNDSYYIKKLEYIRDKMKL